MIIHDIKQGTDEWHELRSGKMTASKATAIGTNGTGLKTYVLEIVSKMYSNAEREDFTTKDTERGHELEPVARDMYEFETGNTVEEVGFIEHNEYSGCSPDGLIGEDGGLEIKCINDPKFFKAYVEKKVDSTHMWQMQMCMLVTGRKWWDYVIFNPNFDNPLITIRVERDEKKIQSLKDGLESGEGMIKEYVEKYKTIRLQVNTGKDLQS